MFHQRSEFDVFRSQRERNCLRSWYDCWVFNGVHEMLTQVHADVIWRLISVCTWFIEFLEGLAKKCVYLGDSLSATDSGSSTSPIKIDTDDDLFGSAPRKCFFHGLEYSAQNCMHLATPVVEHQGGKTPEVTTCPPELLHLIHPFLLKSMATLVGHIIRLKKQVTDTPVSTRKAQLAKLCLSELVNAQGIDLEALPTVLIELSQSASQLSGESSRLHTTCRKLNDVVRGTLTKVFGHLPSDARTTSSRYQGRRKVWCIKRRRQAEPVL
jgi:hypothetical protein